MAGARVLNAQAVEFARARGIVILAKSTFGGGSGTAVREMDVPAQTQVKGVTAEAELGVIAVRGTQQLVSELMDFLDARSVRARMFAYDAMSGEGGFLVVPLQDVHAPEKLESDLRTRFGERASLMLGLGTVTAVGVGINSEFTHLRRALAAAEALNARVHGVQTSPLQLSLLVDRTHLPELTRRLHAEFVAR